MTEELKKELGVKETPKLDLSKLHLFIHHKNKNPKMKIGVLKKDVNGMLIGYKAGSLVLFTPNEVQPEYYYSSFKEMKADANKCTLELPIDNERLGACTVGVWLDDIDYEIIV